MAAQAAAQESPLDTLLPDEPLLWLDALLLRLETLLALLALLALLTLLALLALLRLLALDWLEAELPTQLQPVRTQHSFRH